MKKILIVIWFFLVSNKVNNVQIKSWKVWQILLLILFIGQISFGGKAQELQSYIKEAKANNPDIKSFEFRYNMTREKISEVKTLPNTTISAGYFVSEPETRTGAQRARFSISQMLPWFGTIKARQNYASSMAEKKFVDIVIAKRKLVLAVTQSYYSLYANKAKQNVLDDNIQLLQTYEQLALTSVEVGKSSAVDVLRLQIRQNELQQQKEVLQEEYLAEQTVFNNLLNRKIDIVVEVVPKIIIPAKDPVLSNEGLTLNPELLRYDKLDESVEQSELLNQKESAPNIGFGLTYIPVAARPAMNFSDNGKDIVMPMLTFSIPIFNNKYSSISKQYKFQKLEIMAKKNERLNALENVFAKAQSQRNQARIKFNTQEENLSQAKDAEEILIKNYETGTIDFRDLLDIQELQLKFQFHQIESVWLYYIQSAKINYLINQ